ncbi:MAG: zinc ABC transporter substrate-binding protein [Pirellulales bacterium]|nr:zinc ABC transporter substrate-binding protein [Pirellulales bacterium]
MIRFVLVCAIGGSLLPSASAAALETAAGIPPVAFLVERIGGPHVRVVTLLQTGQDPHSFELTPKQVQRLGRAALFFKVGLPFEQQVLKKLRAAYPDLTVVDTARGIRKISLDATSSAHCSAHDTTGSHPHAGEDPHVWLSPPNLKRQSAEIAAALEKADPERASLYRANLQKLQAELDAVHEKNVRRLKPFAGRTFYVFHPAFGYFAACYGLKQSAIETGGKAPSPRQLRQIIHHAKSDGAKVIFVQPQFNPRSAQAVAQALGANLAPLNDLSKNVVANLEDIGKKMEQALAQHK